MCSWEVLLHGQTVILGTQALMHYKCFNNFLISFFFHFSIFCVVQKCYMLKQKAGGSRTTGGSMEGQSNGSSKYSNYNILINQVKLMRTNSEDSQPQKIHFIIQKQVDYGKAIYVVGNIPQLGSWAIEKSIKLSWFKDHYWTGFVCFSALELEGPVEFKYVIADWNQPLSGEIQWEAGARNRVVDGSLTADHVICENTWNMERITLNLIVPGDSKSEEYSVVGDCKELGAWKKTYKLKEFDKKSVHHFMEKYPFQDGCRYSVFSTSFEIFRGKPKIHYYYIRKQQGVEMERNPGRKYELSTGLHTHKKCLQVAHPKGDTETFQVCNFNELNYSRVTENILLGPYLHTPEDFATLKKEGVTGILSIQTNQDIAMHRLTTDYLAQQSALNGLSLTTYSIQDMNRTQFVQKCQGAVERLTQLVSGNNKVYVHCSAGMYRSPQIVVLFLVLKQGYSIEQAIELVKSRHKFARPNCQTLRNALNFLGQCKYITNPGYQE